MLFSSVTKMQSVFKAMFSGGTFQQSSKSCCCFNLIKRNPKGTFSFRPGFPILLESLFQVESEEREINFL